MIRTGRLGYSSAAASGASQASTQAASRPSARPAGRAATAKAISVIVSPLRAGDAALFARCYGVIGESA
jgi:hypothetical protein